LLALLLLLRELMMALHFKLALLLHGQCRRQFALSLRPRATFVTVRVALCVAVCIAVCQCVYLTFKSSEFALSV